MPHARRRPTPSPPGKVGGRSKSGDDGWDQGGKPPHNQGTGGSMPFTKRRYGKEEFARRGDQIYETQVRPRLKKQDQGKFAAIDIESGQYEVDEDELAA